MTSILRKRGVGQSISFRASLTIELAQKLAAQDQLDAELTQQLLAVVPTELQEWIEQEAILTILFTHGKYDTNIVFYGDYGFQNFGDVNAKLKKLRRVWKDVVTIQIDEPEQQQVRVYFAAVM